MNTSGWRLDSLYIRRNRRWEGTRLHIGRILCLTAFPHGFFQMRLLLHRAQWLCVLRVWLVNFSFISKSKIPLVVYFRLFHYLLCKVFIWLSINLYFLRLFTAPLLEPGHQNQWKPPQQHSGVSWSQGDAVPLPVKLFPPVATFTGHEVWVGVWALQSSNVLGSPILWKWSYIVS